MVLDGGCSPDFMQAVMDEVKLIKEAREELGFGDKFLFHDDLMKLQQLLSAKRQEAKEKAMAETTHDHEKLLKQALKIIEQLNTPGNESEVPLTPDLIAYRDSLKAQNALKKAQLRKLENKVLAAMNDIIEFGYCSSDIRAVLREKVNSLYCLPSL